MKITLTITILIFYSIFCYSNGINNRECYKIIDKIVDNYMFLKNLKYDDSVKVKKVALNEVLESTKNSDEIKELLTEHNFDHGYSIYYDKMLYYIVDSTNINIIAITNEDSTGFLEFKFALLSQIWYLTSIRTVSAYEKYLLGFDKSEDFRRDDKYFVENINNINRIIIDTNFLKEFSYKSKKHRDFFINKSYAIKQLITHLDTIKIKKFKISKETRFSTIDNTLMNHRICLKFDSGEELFLKFVYIDRDWFIESWSNWCLFNDISY